MDDLRTRIAAVIRSEVPCHPPAADRIADALIAELGLREQRTQRSYGNWPKQPQVVFRPAGRYVTEWKWETEDE